jgi:formate dehydrogenase gamma subunit
MSGSASSGTLVIRFSLLQRVQHWALAGSFTLLALTGIPLRFPDVPWLAFVYRAIGGLQVARAVHRAAALVMMLAGVLHLVYLAALLVRARFHVRRAWPMLPAWKDVRDAWGTALYYVGLRSTLPDYDRFNFRQKFDYFAVFWGLPVMMLSGLVLWFPVFFGNLLPDRAIGLAYIAHSDEAILAVLAIVVWHLYNVHLAPGRYHRLALWMDGKIRREEMIICHPREYERIVGVPVSPAERNRLAEEAWPFRVKGEAWLRRGRGRPRGSRRAPEGG